MALSIIPTIIRTIIRTSPAVIGTLISLMLLSPFAYGAEVAQTQAFAIPKTDVRSIESKALGRSYDIYVKLPPGYDNPDNAATRYPVIYLNDGPYAFQVASGVTHLPMGGSHKFERAILVGLSFAKGEHGMHSRVRDLTPVKDESWQNYETGGGPAYLKFIRDEVITLVENTYRADPGQRTLVGHSLGGSFGARVMLEHPGIFANYILTSPSLWYMDRMIFDLEAAYAAAHTYLNANVYLAVGGLETVAEGMNQPMRSQMVEFSRILESRNYQGFNMKTEVIPGAIHETVFPLGFTRGAHWLFGRRT